MQVGVFILHRIDLGNRVIRAACVCLLLVISAAGCNRGATTPPKDAASEAKKDLNLDMSFATEPGPGETEPPNFEDDGQFHIDHDKFIAADDPLFVPAEAADFLRDDDDVLGFRINGEARAYSIRALSYHHVVNDTIGDTPMVVTY